MSEIKSVQLYNCENKCCNFKITPYNQLFVSHGDTSKFCPSKIIKAGSFVIDKTHTKILLVQSRGKMWGPPKGTIQEGETHQDCAVREVFEETGMTLSPNMFLGETIVKNRAIYYTTEISEFEVTPQNHIKDNDANGIGWFSIDCLQHLISEKLININQHTKILIKKFFDKVIV